MTTITEPLKQEGGIDVSQAWRDMINLRKVTLPSDEKQRLAFLYQIVLKARNNEVELLPFGAYVFNDPDPDSTVYHFNDTFSRPLVRSLRQRLSEIEDQSPLGPAAIVSATTNTEPLIAASTVTVERIMSQEDETSAIIERLAARYQELGERSYQEGRYSRRTAIFLYIWAGGLVLSLFFASPSIISLRIVFPQYLIPSVVGDVAAFVLATFYARRLRSQRTDREQRLFIDVYGLATELKQYPAPIPTVDASMDLADIVEELNSIWVLRFRLAKKTLSNVTTFIKYLRDRMVPALAAGKTDDVKLSAWVLAKLCPLLIDENPLLSDVEEMSDALSQLPEPTTKAKPKLHVRMRELAKAHSSITWAAAISGCVVVGVIIFAAGVYLGYPREGFIAGTGASVAIFAGYLASPRFRKSTQ